MKYLLKNRRQENLITYFDYATLWINKTQREMNESRHPPFSQERWQRDHNRCITLIAIAGKVLHAKLINCIQPEIEKILRKNPNNYREYRSTTLPILTTSRIIEGVRAKKSQAAELFVVFFGGIWVHTQGKNGANATIIWSPQRNCCRCNYAL